MRDTVQILCAGNELCGDDGLAHRVGRILARLDLPPGVSVHHYQEFGWDLIDVLATPGRVILVDATSMGVTPGHCTVARLDAIDRGLGSGLGCHGLGCHGLGCHGLGLADLVELASELFPGRRHLGVTLVGVEGERFGEYEVRLSPTVEKALPEAVQRVLELLGADAALREEGRRVAEAARDWAVGLRDVQVG